ncbi:DUF4159 domain-containing protein [Gellertiella hungarica]|uniref:RNA-binding protein n=1 Tax=Gellertiella hungarica TaxID=1572859 RepID=A0A7W6J234_9HYPH|nr:DUF4159 domain-containing protein [Gellertiella hungarica]MBB4063371.1 hypothetical protein [Gellertiella hungarica]
MSAIGFATPAVLAALLALPAIWWLLRITPPKPEREVFPPFRILAQLMKREETPAQSPWWLTALRILLAAAVILAMAGPVLNPRQASLSPDGPLVLVVDNSWAAANDWEERVSAARDLLEEAESENRPVALVLTAEDKPDATPVDASTARTRLLAARPRPVMAQRTDLPQRIRAGLDGTAPGTLAFITDGIGTEAGDRTLETLTTLKPAEFRLLSGDSTAALAITSVRNVADGVEVQAARLDTGRIADLPLVAYDRQGRAIAGDRLQFVPGASQARAVLKAPLEIRNDFARIALGDRLNAGTVHLLDEGAKRRRVALIGGDAADAERPLLSSIYYIRRALSPFADISESRSVGIEPALKELLSLRPSAIVMADVGKVPAAAVKPLSDYIESGGTLIRFAGPQLAAAGKDDPFATVPLREGERRFGGVLSWSEPQAVAAFPETGPFAGLARAEDVKVRRQVLAEPSPELAGQTIASLADGTPFVTMRQKGRGQIVLFHVSAETSWSDLPLSGHFVEMLRALVQMARAPVGRPEADGKVALLPPWRLLAADGALSAETASARPLNPAKDLSRMADLNHPPGLYGTEDGFVAHNLLPEGAKLSPLDPGPGAAPWLKRLPVTGPQPANMVPAFIGAAIVLLLLDGLAMLWINGGLRLPRKAAASLLLPLALGLALGLTPAHTRADDAKPGDDVLLKRLDTTHLAYVLTGEKEVDDVSRMGLYGLTQFLTFRTALEPGEPEGVDIARDELSVFPLIYWPVSASAPMPSADAISRIGAYMRSGGTVLFDTRDQSEQAFGGNGVATANGERLREILADLDIPPLEPVPRGHVLTRSFYLLSQFPGRYADSPLWVEAGQGTDKTSEAAPVSADGVTPIMITANDLAGAWAIDEMGNPQLPTVPPDENQREFAYRAGVNIMMYMLTGNYKGDQVHVPALLERLGN